MFLLFYIGGRGLLHEVYNFNGDLNTFRTFASRNPANQEIYTEITESSGNNPYFNTRYTGFFVPPFSGLYTYYIRSDDTSIFYLSPNMSIEHTRLVASVPRWTTAWNTFDSQKSVPIKLDGGKPCYLEIIHTQFNGPWNIGFGAKYHNTNVTSSTVYGDYEEQQIHISVEIKKETHVRLQEINHYKQHRVQLYM